MYHLSVYCHYCSNYYYYIFTENEKKNISKENNYRS